MRIIGGEFRGRKLSPPSDNRIRPTSDRMRETIFNILEHSTPPLDGANILDVFAGTGAMGLEALSRGAAHATFFDKNSQSLKLVKKNIALLKLGERTTVKATTAPLLPFALMKYDVVFLDPPYNLNITYETIITLTQKEYLAKNCIIIVESSSGAPLEYPDYLAIKKEKIYGEARFTFLKM